MKIGIISKKPHAKNHAQALKREGHDVVLLDGDPKRIPSSIDLVICRTASCSHGASNVALEWQRSGGGFLVMENGLSGALRAIRQYIEPKKNKSKKEEVQPAPPAPVPEPTEPTMRKMTGDLVEKAITMVGEGESLTKVAKHFNVARSTLTRALIEAGGWPQTSQPLSPEPQPPAEDVLEAGPPPSESEIEELIETWAVLVVETRSHDNFEQRLEVMKGLMEVEVEEWRLRGALMAAAGENVPLLHEPEEDLEVEAMPEPEPEPEPEPVEVVEVEAPFRTPPTLDREGDFVLPPMPVPEPHFLKACPTDRILNDLPTAHRLAGLVSDEYKEKFRTAFLSHDRNPKKAGSWIPRDLKKADAPFASAKGKPLVFALLVFLLLDPEDEPSGRAFTHAYKELTKKGTDSRFPKAAAWALGRTLGEALRGKGSGKKPSSDSLSETEKTHFLQALARKKDMLAEKDAVIQNLQQELEKAREEEDRLRQELEFALRSRSQQPPAIGASPAPAPSTGLTLDLTVDDLVRAGFQVHVTKARG